MLSYPEAIQQILMAVSEHEEQGTSSPPVIEPLNNNNSSNNDTTTDDDSVLDLSLPTKRSQSFDVAYCADDVLDESTTAVSPQNLSLELMNNLLPSSPPAATAAVPVAPSNLTDEMFIGPSPRWPVDILASEDGTFKCPECGKVLPTRVGLKRHIFYHNKPFITSEECAYKCDLCPAAFQYRTSLEYHRVAHTLDGSERLHDGTYKCDECHKVFDGLKSLKRHKMKRAAINGQISVFSCTGGTSSGGVSSSYFPPAKRMMINDSVATIIKHVEELVAAELSSNSQHHHHHHPHSISP